MKKSFSLLFLLFVLFIDAFFVSTIDSRDETIKSCFNTLDSDNRQLEKDKIQFDQIREGFNEH